MTARLLVREHMRKVVVLMRLQETLKRLSAISEMLYSSCNTLLCDIG